MSSLGNATPGLESLYNSSRASTPWIYLNMDRTKCMSLGLSMSDVFTALQVYLGSYYVNNFNDFGRSWQVNIMADREFRDRISKIQQLKVRNLQGSMVPLGTALTVHDTTGPAMIIRYNMYEATAITGRCRRARVRAPP